MKAHAELLADNLLGNPHSGQPRIRQRRRPWSSARGGRCSSTSTRAGNYTAVFTANATAALKLVGESYPFAPGGRLSAHLRQSQFGERHPRVRARARARRSSTCRSPCPISGSIAHRMSAQLGEPSTRQPEPPGLPRSVEFLRREAPARSRGRSAREGLGCPARRGRVRADQSPRPLHASVRTSCASRSTRCSATRPAWAACWSATTRSSRLTRPVVRRRHRQLRDRPGTPAHPLAAARPASKTAR